MKIAFLADSFLLDPSTGVNGTQVQMYNLASAFARRGLEVHYLAHTADRPKEAVEVSSAVTVHWFRQKSGVIAWLSDFHRFRSTLDEIKPDVVYQRGRSHLTYIAAEWAKKNRKKFVWGSNGEDSCDFWKNIGLVKRSLRSRWKKVILYPSMLVKDFLIHRGIRGASAVVNQTEHQRNMLQRNYGKAGIVLPNYFLPPSDQERRDKEKRVLWLANLSRGKQPEIFIDLAGICGPVSGWEFTLGGSTQDEAYWSDLKKRADKLENLELVGAIPFERTDVYFQKAALFVNTSRPQAEGLPNTFIQAWLHQTPVLSLHHDPNGWINRHRLGFFARGDLDVFIQKGGYFLDHSDELRDMGRKCAEFATTTFAAEGTIDAYLKLFEA